MKPFGTERMKERMMRTAAGLPATDQHNSVLRGFQKTLLSTTCLSQLRKAPNEMGKKRRKMKQLHSPLPVQKRLKSKSEVFLHRIRFLI